MCTADLWFQETKIHPRFSLLLQGRQEQVEIMWIHTFCSLKTFMSQIIIISPPLLGIISFLECVNVKITLVVSFLEVISLWGLSRVIHDLPICTYKLEHYYLMEGGKLQRDLIVQFKFACFFTETIIIDNRASLYLTHPFSTTLPQMR